MIATTVYWFLLLYIVAVLVWWFIALQQQNRQMTNYRVAELSSTEAGYREKLNKINGDYQRKSTRNIGEGGSFLLVIIIGAVLIYRIVRRQFQVSQQQQNFIMAVTHELKTPIAITKLNLETLQKHRLDEGKRQKLLGTTLEETERLNTLTSNILISFQLDGGRYHVAKEELNFSALAENCLHQFKHRFPDRAWNTDAEEDVSVNGDSLLLQILLNNLLENAVKYSPKGSPVCFRLAATEGFVEMTITDQGPGIPGKEKKKIFERFYRMGNELTRRTKGTGLGLYLCKKIARDHQAVISVQDNAAGGSSFLVSFKR